MTRALLVAVALAAAPAARADLLLIEPDVGQLTPPAATLGTPVLALEVVQPPVFFDDGAGAGGGRSDPAISLVLGIIPGFGLGHLVANSPRWTTWLVVDIALLAVWVIVASVDTPAALDAVVAVGSVVERIFEGIDAYRAAGGRGLGAAESPGQPTRLAYALPVRDPGARSLGW